MWNDGDDRWGMHEQSGGGWLMVLLMLILVVAVVVAVVALLRGTTTSQTAVVRTPGGAPDPRAVLQDRFARGEIDESDFRARMRALDETGRAGG